MVPARGVLGRSLEGSRLRLCQDACMHGLNELQAERNALERRLVELERPVDAQQLRLVTRHGVVQEVADFAASVAPLLDQLRVVNAKLAELRGPAAAP